MDSNNKNGLEDNIKDAILKYFDKQVNVFSFRVTSAIIEKSNELTDIISNILEKDTRAGSVPVLTVIHWMEELVKASECGLQDPGIDDPYLGLEKVDDVVKNMKTYITGE